MIALEYIKFIGKALIMTIDDKIVQEIAHLARIKVSSEECEGPGAELSNIFDWIAQLDEVKTDGVDPMTSAVQALAPLRKDEANDGGYPESVTANAPGSIDQFFTVPKVIE